jgi:hypothetical protein
MKLTLTTDIVRYAIHNLFEKVFVYTDKQLSKLRSENGGGNPNPPEAEISSAFSGRRNRG